LPGGQTKICLSSLYLAHYTVQYQSNYLTFCVVMYELIIIGGGPGGVSAGIYASRKQLKTLLITKEWGGQSNVSDDIQNWIGTPHIKGGELALNLKKHLESYADGYVDYQDSVEVKNVISNNEGYEIETTIGNKFITKALLIASGSKRRQLAVKGALDFEHKGLTYCASCDGPIFAGQDVLVIGGGNAAFETAAQLLAYTKSVTLIQRGEVYKADPVTVEKVLAHPNMTAISNTEILEVSGEKFVSGLRYLDKTTNEEKLLNVSGIFVEIGMIPNTHYLNNLVEMDEYNRIVIDPWTQKTSAKNIWAAGDCTNILYHQNNIASGDAVRALEDIYVSLRAR
jgi:NADH-dependent peroxiredoxin subunit F